MRVRRFIGIAAVIAIHVATERGTAQSTSWIGTTGSWFDEANWSTSEGMPGASISARVNNGGTALIDSGPAEAREVRLGENVTHNGNLTVTGPGTLNLPNLNFFTGLAIGERGSGELNIIGGGVVNADFTPDYAYIGMVDGSTGRVTVEGPGSALTNFEVFVGDGGHGILNVLNGGKVTNVRHIARLGGSKGDVTVDGAGSTLTNEGQLYIGHTSFGDRNGTLTVSNGGFVSAQSVFIRNRGTLAGNGIVSAESVGNFGRVSPGASIGSLNINGDYGEGQAAELHIELASATSFDQLLVSGNAGLRGWLIVNLRDDFRPEVGQSFEILSADNIDGAFRYRSLPSIPGVVEFEVSYGEKEVVVTAVAASLPGDYNDDAIVDAADYVVWRKNLGGRYTPADFDSWRAHFGQSAVSGFGAGRGSEPSPEPSTFVLLVATAILGLVPHSRFAR